MPTVKCPNCAANLNAPTQYKGRKVKCTSCGRSFVLRFPTRASSGGSTIFDEDLSPKPITDDPPTSVKMSIAVEAWRAAVYQQITDERFNRDLSAFARAAFDAFAEQLGYQLMITSPRKSLDRDSAGAKIRDL
jgi:hypothetical protein